jgi:hypothetical protein
VVAGESGTLVTGDAVNVAARLEQAAGAREILLGEATAALVRDAVEVERIELALKGKRDPVASFRLRALDAAAAGTTRHLDRPLIGRSRERERLRADWEDVVASRSSRLFTLLGPAGIGKSRLVADFLEQVELNASVARGRALSYGEGITYWPLVEVLLQLGIEPGEAIRSSPAETQIATRAALERVAAEGPLVLVLDDLHWAEPPLLDLVEHIADWTRQVPIFLLCVARPDLLDLRPGWGGGKPNATSILIEPLGGEEAGALVNALLGGADLDEPTRAKILDSAEGNPLFLEEMVALAREVNGRVDVPPTIHALLQARLDRLSDHERSVIERGAVEGTVFHRGAVVELAPEQLRADVPAHLVALMRKELVRPERAQLAGDDAFRFRHLLIRDTAYEALPKARRADLHERFAVWLDRHDELLERDEIVGYHLEQAARYREELDPEAPGLGELRLRAAERLGRAGEAALERDDLYAVRSLLFRAGDLLPLGSPERLRRLPPLVEALAQARDERAVAFLAELEDGDAVDRAAASALRLLPGLAELFASTSIAELDSAQEAAVADLDWRTLALCERARGWEAFTRCQMRDARDAFQRSLDATLAGGSRAGMGELLVWAMSAMVHGPFSGEEIEAQAIRSAELAHREGLLVAGSAVRVWTALRRFLRGVIDREETEDAVLAHVALLGEAGFERTAATYSYGLGIVAETSGDLEATEQRFRDGIARFVAIDDAGFRGNMLGHLGRVLCRRGRPAEALAAIAEGRGISHADDVADREVLDAAEAHARSLLGEVDRAEELAASAETVAVETDLVHWLISATLARAAAASGDLELARDRYARAIELADYKGEARNARLLREELRTAC